MSLLSKLFRETQQCVKECKASLRETAEYADSTEGKALRAKATSIKDNSKRDRQAFVDYTEGRITADEYLAIRQS